MGPRLNHEIPYTNNSFIDMMSSFIYSLRSYPPQKNLRQATLTLFTLQGSTCQSCPLEWIEELLKITWCLSTPNQLTHSLWGPRSQHKHVLGAQGCHCVFRIEVHCADKTIYSVSIFSFPRPNILSTAMSNSILTCHRKLKTCTTSRCFIKIFQGGQLRKPINSSTLRNWLAVLYLIQYRHNPGCTLKLLGELWKTSKTK